jgi:DNA invertase Pin-like site-specific DNA recombinase
LFTETRGRGIEPIRTLIFTKVDRASRCTEDFARLLRLSEEKDWRLIVI